MEGGVSGGARLGAVSQRGGARPPVLLVRGGRASQSACGRRATERADQTAGEGERAAWGGRPGPRAAESAALLPPRPQSSAGGRAP